MKTEISDFIVHTNKINWIPLKEEGVSTNGIFVKSLRFDEQQQRSPSILLKFEPGASYPYHNHPGGEEIFVLEGCCFVNESELRVGDYLYTPPGFKHAVKSDTGCVLMLNIPQEVEIL
jgi:quercetin dioxygenase-like cupin family protein